MIPQTPPGDSPRSSAADINERIRALTAGRTGWSAEELRVLAGLQAAWREAVAREAALVA